MSEIPAPTSATEALRMILALLADISEPRYINPARQLAELGLKAEESAK